MAFPTSNKENLTHNFATEQILAPQFAGYSPASKKAGWGWSAQRHFGRVANKGAQSDRSIAHIQPLWLCTDYGIHIGDENETTNDAKNKRCLSGVSNGHNILWCFKFRAKPARAY
jgi:hypothetical protein